MFSRSRSGSALAFHFSARAPAQTTRSKPRPAICSMFFELKHASNLCCRSRLLPTNPVWPISAELSSLVIGRWWVDGDGSRIEAAQCRGDERAQNEEVPFDGTDFRRRLSGRWITARHRCLGHAKPEARRTNGKIVVKLVPGEDVSQRFDAR